MLQKNTLKFLQNLSKNNNKPWFDEHRKEYEDAKKDFINFTTELINGIGLFDNSIANLDPKKSIFRINRDIRFSKDKSPYKTNMGASLSCGGKKISKAGYYFHLEPNDKSFIAAGIYMPDAIDLAKVRQEIDYNFKVFSKIIGDKNFIASFGEISKADGMQLARPPKGYTEDNIAIEYLKLKSFMVSKKLTDAELLENGLLKSIIAKYKNAFPLVHFINEIIT